MLERIVRAASHNFAHLTQDEIRGKVRLYVSNPSFHLAMQILESQRILIISGPPGVGKTTLAEMLSYRYLTEPRRWICRVAQHGSTDLFLR